MKRNLVAAGLAVALGAGAATAYAQVKPEVLVKQRQAKMTLQGKYIGPLVGMVKGSVPFNANVAAQNAAYLDTLSKMAWDDFDESTKGEKSRALPAIWTNSAKFKQYQGQLETSTAGLLTAAKGGNEGISKRLVEPFANMRARLLSLPYGDQAIFIKRDIFKKVGGFREYPFLEDMDMAMRVRKFGRLKYLPFHVISSSRRLKKGYPLSPILVSFRNVFIALLFFCGLSPISLIKLYK